MVAVAGGLLNEVIGGLRRGSIHDCRDVVLNQQLPVCCIEFRSQVEEVGDQQRGLHLFAQTALDW